MDLECFLEEISGHGEAKSRQSSSDEAHDHSAVGIVDQVSSPSNGSTSSQSRIDKHDHIEVLGGDPGEEDG